MSKTWRKHSGEGRRRQSTKDHNKTRKGNKVDLTSDKED